MHGPKNLQYYRPWSTEQFVRNRTIREQNETFWERKATFQERFVHFGLVFNSDWCLRTMIAIVSAAVNQFHIHCSFWMTSGSVLMSIQLNFWGVNKNLSWASKLIAFKNIRRFFSQAQILLKIIWKLGVADLSVTASNYVKCTAFIIITCIINLANSVVGLIINMRECISAVSFMCWIFRSWRKTDDRRRCCSSRDLPSGSDRKCK